MAATYKNVPDACIFFTDCWRGHKTDELRDAQKGNFTDKKVVFLKDYHTQSVEILWSSQNDVIKHA